MNQKNETIAMALVSSPNCNVLKITVLPLLSFNFFNESINSTAFHITTIIRLKCFSNFRGTTFYPLKGVSGFFQCTGDGYTGGEYSGVDKRSINILARDNSWAIQDVSILQ